MKRPTAIYLVVLGLCMAQFLVTLSSDLVFAQSPSPSPSPIGEPTPTASPPLFPSPSPLPGPSQAEQGEERLRQILAEQEKAKQDLLGLEKQEQTLKQQITYADTQIKLTGLRVAETKNKIAQAEKELNELVVQIEELSTRIDRIQSTVDELSSILVDRIRETYMRTRISPVELFFSSKGFDEFLVRYQYLRIVQLNDRRLLYQMQATKENYTDHKSLLEAKQRQIELTRERITKEKASLEQSQNTLAKQKADKEALLKVTQNDEERYRKLIELLQGEARQLAKITVTDGKVTYSIEVDGLKTIGQVGAGDTVGKMGNTGAPGCSSGPHLHFETISNAKLTGDELGGTLEDPGSHLNPRTLYYWTNNRSPEQRVVGVGNWSWPLAKPQVTQGYGGTAWSSRYANHFHTALDMAPEEYPGGDWTVKAVSSGTLYSGVLYYGGCSPINVRFIDHGSGLFSLYWHLQ